MCGDEALLIIVAILMDGGWREKMVGASWRGWGWRRFCGEMEMYEEERARGDVEGFGGEGFRGGGKRGRAGVF